MPNYVPTHSFKSGSDLVKNPIKPGFPLLNPMVHVPRVTTKKEVLGQLNRYIPSFVTQSLSNPSPPPRRERREDDTRSLTRKVKTKEGRSELPFTKDELDSLSGS